MKILFTGASSFTGFWFIKALVSAGHEVICPITKDLGVYSGTRRDRLHLLKPLCRLVAQVPFGSDRFLDLATAEPFDLLCHHAADVTNYRSPEFDAQAAVRNNTYNLPAVLAALCSHGINGVVLTGTYFEAGEGEGDKPLITFSPYSLSKTLTFELFQSRCRATGLPLGKFVISNPFGPFEELRFTAVLMRKWRDDQPVEVKTPTYVRDNIHVDLLAMAYAQFVGKVASAKEPLLKTNPSGYVESQGEFAQRVAREVGTRTGWSCALRLAQQTDFSEPHCRTNAEPAAQRFSDWDEKRAWDEFTRFYGG
jgi:UDP-glucose 4-epimerase